ncbi:hypothetical protein [Pleomorphovibrio marinus]|uniref:hypothetical protein n=1 Tax=Pleomorphovibrio marinus TaxID=2164132 RepID=UPI000E0C233F|nr:hypothetical protein [Pleomorphovibrio marinus]
MKTFAFFISLLFLTNLQVIGQVGVMYQMQGKGNGMLGLGTQLQNASSFHLGKERLETIPIYREVNLHRTVLEGTYGITEKLDLQFALPYHVHYGLSSTTLRQDLELKNREQGLQDITLQARYLFLEENTNSGRVQGFGAMGFAAAIGNYQVTENLQSLLAIGNRAKRFHGNFTVLYHSDEHFFGRLHSGYTYSSGPVPAHVETFLGIGVDHKDIFVEAYFQDLHSLNGPDVFGEGFSGAFPFSNIGFQRVGIEIFKPIGSGVGMSLAGFQTLGGRNTFRSTGVSLGIAYLFGRDQPKYNHY